MLETIWLTNDESYNGAVMLVGEGPRYGHRADGNDLRIARETADAAACKAAGDAEWAAYAARSAGLLTLVDASGEPV